MSQRLQQSRWKPALTSKQCPMKTTRIVQLLIVLFVGISDPAAAQLDKKRKAVVTVYKHHKKFTHQKGNVIYYKLHTESRVLEDSIKAEFLATIIKSKEKVQTVLGVNEAVGFIKVDEQFFNITLLNVGPNKRKRISIIPIEKKGAWFAEKDDPSSRHVEVPSDFYDFLKKELAK